MRISPRLTNALSKKVANHALYFMYYSFCRVHSTLRVTPAMEADLGDHVWSVEAVAGPLDLRLQPAVA